MIAQHFIRSALKNGHATATDNGDSIPVFTNGEVEGFARQLRCNPRLRYIGRVGPRAGSQPARNRTAIGFMLAAKIRAFQMT